MIIILTKQIIPYTQNYKFTYSNNEISKNWIFKQQHNYDLTPKIQYTQKGITAKIKTLT